jgi:hypothetical protein
MMVSVAPMPVEVRNTMSPAHAQPSSRLLRAATAERAALERERERLQLVREKLLAEVRELDGALSALSEREVLLERLAPVEPATPGSNHHAVGEPAGSNALPPDASSVPRDDVVLRGPAIREAAVQILLASGGPEALHYRAWFELLTGAGYTVEGKDALAVFLTQLSRSPAVRKTTQAGVYELDTQAPMRLRRRIADLHDQLGELSMRAADIADLGAVRSRRGELTAMIGRAERALEEADRVLAIRRAESAAEAPRPLLAQAS